MQNFKSIIIFCNTIGTAKSTDPPNRPTIEWPHYHQHNTTTHETRTFLSHSTTVLHQVSLPQFHIHTTFQPYQRLYTPTKHTKNAPTSTRHTWPPPHFLPHAIVPCTTVHTYHIPHNFPKKIQYIDTTSSWGHSTYTKQFVHYANQVQTSLRSPDLSMNNNRTPHL